MNASTKVFIKKVRIEVAIYVLDAPLVESPYGMIRPQRVDVLNRGEKCMIQVTGTTASHRGWMSAPFNGAGYDRYPDPPQWVKDVIERALEDD